MTELWKLVWEMQLKARRLVLKTGIVHSFNKASETSDH